VRRDLPGADLLVHMEPSRRKERRLDDRSSPEA
jgi:hypothetical protein